MEGLDLLLMFNSTYNSFAFIAIFTIWAEREKLSLLYRRYVAKIDLTEFSESQLQELCNCIILCF